MIYAKDRFLKKADEVLKMDEYNDFCLVALDIEHFKLFNEWYGADAGDRFLKELGQKLEKFGDKNNGVVGHFNNDDYAVLLPLSEQKCEKEIDKIIDEYRKNNDNAGFVPLAGIYPIDDFALNIETIYDRAVIALSSIKGKYEKRVALWNEQMGAQLLENHILLKDFFNGIKNEEFTFYLQPKCDITNGKVVSVESLVRWEHPVEGLISPAKFIPMLEKNGLIGKLDYYVWEKVCKWIMEWTDKGNKVVPVSVNVSRSDMYTLDILECFKGLTEKYGINPEVLEIEITESAYTEDYDNLKEVIRKLRAMGFLVSIDDFGSGYSSLNMVKDVNVDILKLDMGFMRMETNTEKGIGILEAIINMAKILKLKVIAEGVETQKDANRLKDLGCRYAQGYYYYMPMPIAAFEELIKVPENVDYRGICTNDTDYLSVKNLLSQGIMTEKMLNNFLGAVAFFEWQNNKVRVIQINQNFSNMLDGHGNEVNEIKSNFLNQIYEQDREIFIKALRLAFATRMEEYVEIRYKKENGDCLWLAFRLFFLKQLDNSQIFYSSVMDVSERKQDETLLAKSQKALYEAVHVTDTDWAFRKLSKENQNVALTLNTSIVPKGMIGAYCEEGYPLFFASDKLIEMFGYESYDEFKEDIDGKIINSVHPDEREAVIRVMDNFLIEKQYKITYRAKCKNGVWKWIYVMGEVRKENSDRLVLIATMADISDIMQVYRGMWKTNN